MAVISDKRNDEYFDNLETMEPEVRQSYLDDKAAGAVQNAFLKAPAMKKLLTDAGVNPGDIKTVKDLEMIPITRKTDLIDLQKNNPPYGGVITIKPEDIERVFISPGPVYEIQPSKVKFFARTFWAAGFRKEDVVINTFTYHMSPAGMLFHEGIRDCGSTVVVSGTGNTDMQVQIMKDLKVTGFVGTPSFLNAVISRAGELGIDFKKDLSINKAWFTGEMLAPSLRTVFESEYSIDTYQAYAVTEPGGCLAYECYRKTGMHFMDDYIIEIVDPETGKQLGPGEVGEIVVTPVYDPDWALLRFGTGDLSSYSDEPCECGRTSCRITGIVGRTGDAVKVRGMFVVARQAGQAVKDSGDITSYQLVVGRRNQRDELVLKAEVKDSAIDKDKLSEDINRKFQDLCRIRIDRIEFVEQGTIPEEDQGIIDERKWD
ncbi:MAG: AMP-binding protein [Dehalococcoidales bacterium]|nr:AMP-binding protein [Dehalococcoidales bacterium]